MPFQSIMPDSNDDFPVYASLGITSGYIGLFIVITSSLANQWSALASLAFGYLVLLAPIIMGAIAYRYRQARNADNYRRPIFYASALYFIIAPITLMIAVYFGA